MEMTSVNHPCLKRIVDAIGGDARCRSQSLMAVIEDTSEVVVLRILAHFSESLKEAANAILSGIAGNEFEPAWRACHKIAGTAELLGFETLGQESRQLSALVKMNGGSDPELVERLAQYAAVCLEYREMVVRSCENWKQYL